MLSLRHEARVTFVVLTLALCMLGSNATAQTPNFYTDAKPATPTKSSNHSKPAKPAPESGQAEAAKSKAASDLNFYFDAKAELKTSASVAAKRTTAKPAVAPKAAPAAKSAVAAAKPAPPKPALRTPPAVKIPDEHGLSDIFTESWDLTSYVITPARALKYRIASAERQAARISKALEKLQPVIERREKNVRNAAVAAYLLGQANAGPSWGGVSLTEPHLMAVRTTLKRDALDLQRDWAVYEILRSAENEAAERARLLARKKDATEALLKLAGVEGQSAPSWSPAEVYPRLTEALVRERGLDPMTDQALAEAQSIARQSWRRSSLASLAPAAPDAPPEGWALPEATVALGTLPETTPEPEVQRPAETTLLLRTGSDRTVRAAADGTVAFAGPFRGVGHLVILEHPGGMFSVYENLAGTRVGDAQAVRAGQPIGEATPDGVAGEGWLRFQVRRGVKVVPATELLGKRSAESVVVKAGG